MLNAAANDASFSQDCSNPTKAVTPKSLILVMVLIAFQCCLLPASSVTYRKIWLGKIVWSLLIRWHPLLYYSNILLLSIDTHLLICSIAWGIAPEISFPNPLLAMVKDPKYPIKITFSFTSSSRVQLDVKLTHSRSSRIQCSSYVTLTWDLPVCPCVFRNVNVNKKVMITNWCFDSILAIILIICHWRIEDGKRGEREVMRQPILVSKYFPFKSEKMLKWFHEEITSLGFISFGRVSKHGTSVRNWEILTCRSFESDKDEDDQISVPTTNPFESFLLAQGVSQFAQWVQI